MLEVMIADADMFGALLLGSCQRRRSHSLRQPRSGLTDQNATLTLTDDPPATDHAVDAGAVSWTFAIPEPTVTHAIGQTLALSDFDDAGLDVEAAAVLVASAPGTAGNTLYADSDRGGSDTPLEGELGLGPDEVVISRIRHGAATVLSLNDNNNPASLALDDFFEGDGNGLTMYFQTAADGVVSFDVADQLSGNRNSATVRFTLPADAQTLLNNIPDGGRWIFALAQATPVAVDHEVDAGDVSWSFDIPEPTVTHTAAPTTTDHAVNAGNVAWSFDIPEPTVTHTQAGGVTVNLTGYQLFGPLIRWLDNVSLGTMFSSDGAEQILDSLDLYFSGQVGIAIVGLEHDFTPEFDRLAASLFKPATAKHWKSKSPTQIWDSYIWTPTNGAEVTATHIRDDLTDNGHPDLGEEAPRPTDHAVDAGNVSWSFDLPEPTVAHTSVLPQDHAVNAGNVSWSFTIPQPTITHTAAVAIDHAVNAGSVSWTFHVPQPRVTHSGLSLLARAYRLRVDWDGDGTFGNAHSDVSGNLIALPKAFRGRNYGDQIYGRSEAGYLEAVLRNADGLYNRFNDASDLVDLVVPGRLVELAIRKSGTANFVVRWTGLLDDIKPIEATSGRNRQRLIALGPLSLITQKDVSVAAYKNVSTGDAHGSHPG